MNSSSTLCPKPELQRHPSLRETPIHRASLKADELTALHGVIKTIGHSEKMFRRALMLGHAMVHEPLEMLATAVGILRAFEVDVRRFGLFYRLARRRVSDSRWLSEVVDECKRLVDAVATRMGEGALYDIGPPSPRLIREAERRLGYSLDDPSAPVDGARALRFCGSGFPR